jgi:hypothetical protein
MCGNDRIPSKSNELQGSCAMKWVRRGHNRVAFVAVKAVERHDQRFVLSAGNLRPVLPSRKCSEGISLKADMLPLNTIVRLTALKSRIAMEVDRGDLGRGRSFGPTQPCSFICFLLIPITSLAGAIVLESAACCTEVLPRRPLVSWHCPPSRRRGAFKRVYVMRQSAALRVDAYGPSAGDSWRSTPRAKSL